MPAAPHGIVSAPPSWRAQALGQALAAIRPGIAVEVRPQVESTNTALVERARAGDATPRLLVAEHQTGGRGRLGRTWHSRAGASLTFSLALALAPPDWSGLSLAVGLALADAIDPPRAGRALRLGLKWPNDLLVVDPQGDRKAGGILIETVAAGAARVAVVGVGLNLALQPLDAPGTGYGWLGEVAPGLDAPAALARIAPALLRALLAFERDGFAPLRERYTARDRLAGRAVTTTLPGLPAGVADGVDARGVLWVRAGGQRHAVASGEVSVRAAAPGDAAPC